MAPADLRRSSRPRATRRVAAAVAVLLLGVSASAFAADRYVLIVTGAAGTSDYAAKYREWRTSLTAVLRGPFGYPEDRVIVLAEDERQNERKPTRENVRAALADIERRSTAEDVIVVLLMGHGTSGGADGAKFNLVGPDMSADEWAAAMAPIRGRVVFVNSASGSFPFLQRLARPGRIVITATNSAMQEYETAFPEFFITAFDESAADADKSGRVSVWEAFAYATSSVRKWYEERGQLLTERAVLDDTGDGIGREPDDPKGDDGVIAKVTYVRPDPPITVPATTELGALLRRRADADARLELLRARKPNLAEADYNTQLEALLLEIARLDREIRTVRAAPQP